VWCCVLICPLYCIVLTKNLIAASISSFVLREAFNVNLWLMRCLKSSQFVCLLLKLGFFSWFSACDVSVIKTQSRWKRNIGREFTVSLDSSVYEETSFFHGV
jgi:hypothetical protein